MSKNCEEDFQFLMLLFTQNRNCMSNLLKYSLGIDASKDKVDVCLISVDQSLDAKIKAQHKFANTLSGFKELHAWCKMHCKNAVPLHALMEATGVYYEKLAIYLVDQQH